MNMEQFHNPSAIYKAQDRLGKIMVSTVIIWNPLIVLLGAIDHVTYNKIADTCQNGRKDKIIYTYTDSFESQSQMTRIHISM